jgi:hypothetical protein
MSKHFFDSRFTVGASMRQWDEAYVKNEPMLFSATPRFAWENGGAITRDFLSLAFGITLADEARWILRDSKVGNFNFDSRVHMLMPGWFPCIPGWHHDDVPRSRSDGQPNYSTPEYKSKHILALVNGDICPTEFAVGRVSYEDTPLFYSHPIYSVWHEQVEQDIKEGSLKRVPVPSNKLIHFNCDSFHQGTKAIKNGWRWFGRLSWDAGYEQGRPHRNEVRKQVQVYLEHPMEGW